MIAGRALRAGDAGKKVILTGGAGLAAERRARAGRARGGGRPRGAGRRDAGLGRTEPRRPGPAEERASGPAKREKERARLSAGLGLGRWFGLGLGLSFVLGFLSIFYFSSF